MIPFKIQEVYEAFHIGTYTCCEDVGDPLDEGNSFVLHTSAKVEVDILGSEHKKGQHFVGSLRVAVPGKPNSWREITNFTEGMTNTQFDKALDLHERELEDIYDSAEYITIVQTEFLDETYPLEFSRYSDVYFLHMSNVTTHTKGLTHTLEQIRDKLRPICDDPNTDESVRDIYKGLEANFPSIGERPSKRARK